MILVFVSEGLKFPFLNFQMQLSSNLCPDKFVLRLSSGASESLQLATNLPKWPTKLRLASAAMYSRDSCMIKALVERIRFLALQRFDWKTEMILLTLQTHSLPLAAAD